MTGPTTQAQVLAAQLEKDACRGVTPGRAKTMEQAAMELRRLSNALEEAGASAALLREFIVAQDANDFHNCEGRHADCPATCWDGRVRNLLKIPAPAPRVWARNNEATGDLLSLTGEGSLVPRAAIDTWTDEQCQEAEQWAGAAHLNASDNDDVVVPPIPAHVRIHDTPENRKRVQDESDAFWGNKPANRA